MKKRLVLFLMTGLVLGPAVGLADAQSTSKEEKQQEKAEKQEKKAEENRSEIDTMAKQTLQELFERNPDAKDLYGNAYGHAAFAQTEAKLMLSTGSGRGVAHRKSGGEPIYMRMASAGVGVGLGLQRVRVVFLFETQQRFDRFVNKGWDADASASAAAGTEGANVKASFVDGMAIFQFTKAGLIAQASVKGTKYWKADKLNEGRPEE